MALIDTKQLIQPSLDNLGIGAGVKPVNLPGIVKPVGIASPVNVGGSVATKTSGSGSGIFNQLLNIGQTLYSTYKGATATSESKVADQVSGGKNTFVNGGSTGSTVEKSDNILLKVGIIVLVLKFFKII